MIPEITKEEIFRRIRAAEKEHDVRVIFAVESGSRAWGFASQNSDFDVRFVYVRPKEWYLSVDLEDKRDVIEYDIVDEIDINGWDIRKALKLLWKSNPTIVEWLRSPIVYIDDGVFAKNAIQALDDVYSIEKGIYHYRSMAKTNYKGYLKQEFVSLKKYFYVLRPLLSIMWLESKGEPAPIEFHLLRELIKDNSELNQEITDLVSRKVASQEKETIPVIKVLNDFIELELNRLESYSGTKTDVSRDIEKLNNIFRVALG